MVLANPLPQNKKHYAHLTIAGPRQYLLRWRRLTWLRSSRCYYSITDPITTGLSNLKRSKSMANENPRRHIEADMDPVRERWLQDAGVARKN